MLQLVLGIVLFFGIHSASIVALPTRDRAAARRGLREAPLHPPALEPAGHLMLGVSPLVEGEPQHLRRDSLVQSILMQL